MKKTEWHDSADKGGPAGISENYKFQGYFPNVRGDLLLHFPCAGAPDSRPDPPPVASL